MSTLQHVLQSIEPVSPEWRSKARERILNLTMPPWALGRLLDLAVDLAGITRSLNPPIARRSIVVMAADHGVTQEGVSAFPQEVTPQMVRNFVAGGAGVNVLARHANARVFVVDVGIAVEMPDLTASGAIISRRIANGTANIAKGPAMSRPQALQSIETGMAIAHDLDAETDWFATGEMGIGNTTPSSAIASVLCAIDPAIATGPGTGVHDKALRHKADVVCKAISVNQPVPDDPIDILAKIGGFEIGAIAGLILGAASLRKPVFIDGFVSTAGALIAQALQPLAADYMIAAHQSAEPAHQACLARLNKKPLLDLGLRLGEGTGAVLAMHLAEAAVRILTEMATFEAAGVADH